MTDILFSIINMSGAASIVAVAVIIARLLLKKAPKMFSYLLWAVVFLRLVCPIQWESPASLMPANAEIIPISAVFEPVPHMESSGFIVEEPANRFVANPIPEADPTARANPVPAALAFLAYVWLSGTTVLLSYAVIGYFRLKRRVYDATIECRNIYRTDRVATAFVLGFARPRIYIPLNCDSEQLAYILKHEQVHVKRRDYLIKPLAFIILAVHWFNPVIWISYFLMSKDMEMSCDEAVLRCSADDLRQKYSMLLVNLYTRKPAILSPLAFGEGSYHTMKARINNVMNFKKAPKWAIGACSLFLMIFMVGFTTNSPQGLTAGDTAANTVNSSAPLIVDSAWVDFNDGIYKWPMLASYVTNTGNKNIIYFEQAFMAFDKDGNPLELYWDARGVDQNGGIGNAGSDIIITGISPVSPKTFVYVKTKGEYDHYMENYDYYIKELQPFYGEPERKIMLDMLEKERDAAILEPGETDVSEYSNLFDGWDRRSGTHQAAFILSCIKSVTFEDKTVWSNPDYADWVLQNNEF